jgi:diguanylate cyclase (GGDEF)-like protein
MTRHLHTSILLLSALGFALSGFIGLKFHQAEAERIEDAFRAQVDAVAALLGRELKLSFEALYALKWLYEGSQDVEPGEFKTVARSIRARHGAIEALGWSPRVAAGQRARFERGHHNQAPGLAFWELGREGAKVPAEGREEHFPLTRIEPLAGQESLLGFDIAASPSRREAMQRARASGEMVISSHLVPLSDASGEKGFLTLGPVYADAAEPRVGGERRLRGFVLGVFRIADIMANATADRERGGVAMTLVDATAPGASTVLYGQEPPDRSAHRGGLLYRKSLPDIADRHWVLVARASPEHVAARRTVLPYILGGMGMVLVTFFFTYVSLVSKHLAVERTVQRRTRELREANEKLERLSRFDELTGLANRRYFKEFLTAEWKRAVRRGSRVAILMIDIDCFKPYNDHYGHLAGDRCIERVAGTLRALFKRPADLVARYGGEEVSVVLADGTDVAALAEACRRAVEDLAIPHAASTVARVVTISVGASAVVPSRGMEADDLVRDADRALYRAKAAGRNCVRLGGPGQRSGSAG